ncbi:HsdM family class I SAM-dependent methyltransferase [Aliarcobacter butzleri]|uniref:HsdM family class I SAM-dependent methyltransferase n=1 Tax=Aliarcobacter butzleri TaxID=28197 RepID=UPI001EDAB908|nr:Eco57I restriction-modification methylase domain-containing protein [Aliarcobacter butzleri]MCG3691829.1 Eco57I restriction-modification methylase domain-containing protein [Aliarcobacter butzleri]
MLTTKIEIIGNEPEKKYAQTISLEHRKRYAQFFTPFVVAKFMTNWILGNKELKTVLDPAFGLGIFARAIRQKNANCFIKGFEIDETILQEANTIFEHEKDISISLKDYMFNDWGNRYDGIICNPPYFKFHDYDNKTVLKEIEENLGLKLNGFTNLYTLFLLKSAYQLNKNGRSAYIVPSEFLNSDYGKLVKSYLIENKLLRYIIVFDFEENVFDDALTTASILLFANDNEKSEVEFINVKSLDELQSLQTKIQSYPKNKAEKTFSFSELNPEIKWRVYYQKQNATRFKNLVPFSTYGKVVRGIATGANEYFTFNQSKAKQYSIHEKYMLPCITKSVDVKGSFFTKEDFEELKQQDKNIFLFNVTEQNEALSKYILKGEAEEINKKFLTASRNPWYALEKRPPSPIWVSVFNRNGLRFIRNEANISNLTTFHCIYLNLFSEPKVDLLFAYLLTNISKEIFNDNRREYGNGLYKFEPNDINKAQIINLDSIDKEIEKKILKLYFNYRDTELSKKPNINLLEKINDIFSELLEK